MEKEIKIEDNERTQYKGGLFMPFESVFKNNKYMQAVLADGRKAEVIGSLDGNTVKIVLENGRELYYPKDKLKKSEPEPTDNGKLVYVPAIDRLEEFYQDCKKLEKFDNWLDQLDEISPIYKLGEELFEEVEKDFKNKWGIEST